MWKKDERLETCFFCLLGTKLFFAFSDAASPTPGLARRFGWHHGRQSCTGLVLRQNIPLNKNPWQTIKSLMKKGLDLKLRVLSILVLAKIWIWGKPCFWSEELLLRAQSMAETKEVFEFREIRSLRHVFFWEGAKGLFWKRVFWKIFTETRFCFWYVPGTCLSSILGLEPSKRRPKLQSK